MRIIILAFISTILFGFYGCKSKPLKVQTNPIKTNTTEKFIGIWQLTTNKDDILTITKSGSQFNIEESVLGALSKCSASYNPANDKLEIYLGGNKTEFFYEESTKHIVTGYAEYAKMNNSNMNGFAPVQVTDTDGNVYETVKIGTQIWMKQNLKTRHYRDGSAIIERESSSTWNSYENLATPAWCYYKANPANNAIYGKLYNWYAVIDSRELCPAGWHVPTDSDFQRLSDYLGGNEVSGGHLKSIELWTPRNTGADNSSGFTALPAGDRNCNAIFDEFGYYGDFWSSTNESEVQAWYRQLGGVDSHFYRHEELKGSGLSVRCIKD